MSPLKFNLYAIAYLPFIATNYQDNFYCPNSYSNSLSPANEYHSSGVSTFCYTRISETYLFYVIKSSRVTPASVSTLSVQQPFAD